MTMNPNTRRETRMSGFLKATTFIQSFVDTSRMAGEDDLRPSLVPAYKVQARERSWKGTGSSQLFISALWWQFWAGTLILQYTKLQTTHTRTNKIYKHTQSVKIYIEVYFSATSGEKWSFRNAILLFHMSSWYSSLLYKHKIVGMIII